MSSTDTTISNDTMSLRSSINNGLRQAIFEDVEENPTATLLYDLIYGNTTASLTKAEVIAITHKYKDTESFLPELSTQIIFLASEYSFLNPQLISLVECILHSKPSDLPNQIRPDFISAMSTTLSDTTRANYGNLFEERHRTPDLIRDHINLNRFIARLLSAVAGTDGEDITGIDDALFILVVGLEGHADSHNFPDVDVPVAAQYVIHAGDLLFEACKNSVGFNKAEKSPSWGMRGKLWTGNPGLSRERWNFWKSRFQAFSETSGLAEETYETVRTAVRAMQLVEGL